MTALHALRRRELATDGTRCPNWLSQVIPCNAEGSASCCQLRQASLHALQKRRDSMTAADLMKTLNEARWCAQAGTLGVERRPIR